MFPSATRSLMKTQPKAGGPAALQQHANNINMERMRKGNLNQVDMRYGKAFTNPQGFLFIPCSHACKYSCYHLADGLSWLGNEARPQLTNTPVPLLASGCIPLPHESVDNDKSVSESPGSGPVLICGAGQHVMVLVVWKIHGGSLIWFHLK